MVFLFAMPCVILSAPIISRLTASINVIKTNPSIGNANTVIDTAIDNNPTPISNALDHLEICRLINPWKILATPKTNKPIDRRYTKRIVAKIGNIITDIPNAVAMAPNTIFVILEDFLRWECIPAAILSNPINNNVIERSKIKVAMPAAGFIIIIKDKIIAIAPKIICKIPIVFNDTDCLIPFDI